MKRHDFNLLPGQSFPEVKIEPYFIVLDTETNGKILDYKLPCENVDNYPRLSQLSYKIYDGNAKLIKTFNEFVIPTGWVFPNEKFFIENADIKKNFEIGKPVKEVLQEFIKDRLSCSYIVAHNINFDTKVMRAEMIRAGFLVEFKAKKYCTMMKSISYCKIPFPSGKKGNKYPSLTELYNHLFKGTFDGAHDSMNDVDACAKCFFELINRKVIVLD